MAADAIKNGWVFIYLKDPTLLAQTLRLSKNIDRNGKGVFVFVEDIDQVTAKKRDAALQDILNTLDGGDTKDMNVITLFTTNHIESIEPTFLRGKRIGSVISLGYLDSKTAERFLRESFKGKYTLEDDLSEICKYVENKNIAPAFMAEIIESIKSNMIFDESVEVKISYIKASVDSYIRQVELTQKKSDMETDADKLYNSLKTLSSGTGSSDQVAKNVEEILKWTKS